MAKILFATTAAGVKFYPVTITDAVVHIKGNTQKKLSEIIDEIDYSGKADKVSGATNGNFAGLDGNGNLIDSGKKAADFKTVQTAVSNIAGDTDKTLATLSQNANGEISYTMQAIQDASASQHGLMSSTHYSKLEGIEANAEVNDLEGVQVNGSDLTIDGNKKVNIQIAEGSTDGTIAVNGGDVAVHGLGSAAYENTTAFDAAGAAATAKSEVIGESTDASSASTIYGAKKKAEEEAAAVLGTAQDAASANTVYGAKAYADALVAGGIIYKGTVDGTNGLPASDYKKGDYYKVAAAGTYAGHVCQVGDALIANKNYASGATASADWDMLQGSVAVTDEGASLVIGTATKVAEVEGVSINVTQVEDMTKIEAVAVADTTEYADVTSLFTAPAGE